MFDNRTVAWYQYDYKCLKNTVRVVDDNHEASGKTPLPRKTNTIIPEKKYPELYLSSHCNDNDAN